MEYPSISQLAFSMLRGMTAELAAAVLAVVGTEERFFEMSESELVACSQLSSRFFRRDYRDGLLSLAEGELEFILKNTIKATYFSDGDYPVRLQTVPDAPVMLFQKGACDLCSKHIVSIVGTRHATAYGVGLCRDLVAGLKSQIGDDVVVVSGLAYGIDVAAHLAALEYGLPTVAVLAHGLDMIYPAQHRGVARDIVRNGGAVVTEYCSRSRVHKGNFLARNRIVAALSDCTVVVESASKGGALVTANIAQGYGREVMAFPGRSGDEFSRGCNDLIRRNVASLIEGVGDLVDLLQWKRDTKPVEAPLFVELTPQEEQVVAEMRKRDVSQLNDLCGATRIPVHVMLGLLFELELKGIVRVLPGNRYQL